MKETSAPHAPGALELVRTFVNTLDLEDGTDALADPGGWSAWAAPRGFTGAADNRELGRLRQFREALRAGLLANHGGQSLPEETRAALDSAHRWSGATTRFTDHGLELKVAGDGAKGLAGTVVAAVAAALADGTWRRLRACRDDACRWAFYDHSRSRTGQWCSMEICGNRNKQARWRTRQGGTS